MALVPVQADQAPALSALCYEIYPQTFTYLWDDAGAWYMDAMYSVAKMQEELRDPNARFDFLALDGRRVGYLKLKLDSDLAGEPGGLEVERIYLSQDCAGQGLGGFMLAAAIDVAQQRHKRYAWLHVMDSSLDAIRFYEKHGFSIVGETMLPFSHMLPHYRRMWRMRKPLA
ncbi:N-acetyltransferase [Lysobacter helvus]|uniref:N-acetyltransferase n=2 Tax=Lysobacteraceae TaxID=32033 RepID=A0ABM7Q304_9GAMM|nr:MULTISPECIES: GNAT family N-acetyltransferase [Lysobacter]BCT91655.1 N-acetyltransferase [Lysobacter caseinilyticus]BCT94808.1 N-acetyltransferase [Lysobacter helvus]